MSATGTPFDQEKYISLGTFKKDGTMVPTPVWCAPLDGNLVVFTLRETYKVKRLRRDPRVVVAKCDVRGKLLGPWHDGRGALVEDAAREARAYAAFRKKYGWVMRLGDALSTLSGRMKRRVIIEISLAGTKTR